MSSKRRYHRRSCASKVKHRTAEAANHAIRVLLKQHKFRGHRVYPCKFCGGYHIGRPKGK